MNLKSKVLLFRLILPGLFGLPLAGCSGNSGSSGTQVVSEKQTDGNNTPVRQVTDKGPAAEVQTDKDLAKINLPTGFRIDYFAKNIEGARSMTISPGGTVFVGSRGQGKVYALQDKNRDSKADKVITIASGLRSPNGVAFRNGSLYVAEINRILRFDNIEQNLENPPKPVVIYDKYPTDGSHGWKFIAFGPDGKLYVPVGAPCNICEPEKPVYASITRLNADGSGLEIFASGIRNTVGFDWHPETKELWFTDNGRDMMGDNIPPDELNKATKTGQHFGYPYCHGNGIKDPEFGKGKDCSSYVGPVQALGPHVAALGMRFYTGSMFPEQYKNRVFIAEHGSWNRSSPLGYRITMVNPANPEYETFAEGWLQNGDRWGRPVDVQILPDGSMLVSDDYNNAVYRISYGKN